ncbi:MAG: hypothetical protein GY811_04480 [Myxococcales bacterium]|nr:hypothetical protein [Myxococcales bacterium]
MGGSVRGHTPLKVHLSSGSHILRVRRSGLAPVPGASESWLATR